MGNLLNRTINNPWYPAQNRQDKPYKPNQQQLRFLLMTGKEVFFGGSAGPGKSEALLQAAAMYLDTPNYHAIIFRKTLASLEREGGLIPRSKEWWMDKPNRRGLKAKWNGADYKWTFPPHGTTIEFGYLQNANDRFQYGSTEYQSIGFDEVTEHDELDYLFMFSRLRGTRDLTEKGVPLRMRSASNPLGPGVTWVKARYNLPEGRPDRPYVSATLRDNAENIDVDAYVDSLSNLDPITRDRLLKGDWTIKDPGKMFQREWLLNPQHPTLPRLPGKCHAAVRYWDLAATSPKPGRDPDYTAGVLMAIDERREVYVLDMRKWQDAPSVTEQRILQAAVEDSQRVDVEHVETWMEEEGGASGKSLVDHYARDILGGIDFRGNKATGSKEIRASPFSSYAANGHVWLVGGVWVPDYLNELEGFPYAGHDDVVDASSGSFEKLMKTPSGPMQIAFGRRPL